MSTYYVSVRDGSRSGLLEGPYPSRVAAESRVESVRRYVVAREPRAHFYGFGVARTDGIVRPGLLGESAAPASRVLGDLGRITR